MAKRAPSNSMPWPENLIYDFHLPLATDAEEFINTLPTSDKNKEFLRLRYRDGQSYNDIAPMYGISAGGVRQAVKYVIGRYISSATPIPSAAHIPSADAESSPSADATVSLAVTDAESSPSADAKSNPSADAEGSPSADAESGVATSSDSGVATQSNNDVATPPQKKPIREELKPIIAAIATTTRQRNFVYDSKTRVVLATDNVPKGLRRDSRYINLPDYYQIKEYDLMQEFASTLADSEKSRVLEVALGGLGPFKAFRSTVRDIGLGQAWADFRYQRFADMAEDWWGREVEPAVTTLPDSTSNTRSKMDTRGEAPPASAAAEKPETGGVVIVDPATLNGIALIETIRVLYRRVGPANFEEALDELRDALCSIAVPAGEA